MGNRFIGQKAEGNKDLVISRLAEIQTVLNSETAGVDELKKAAGELIKLYTENNPDEVQKLIESYRRSVIPI